MAKIKAIETVYNGYRFRSRLKARWAVFFDSLGIQYEYEPEGFDLGDAGWYLPDFWLSTFDGGLYCAVKFAGGDFSKALEFAKLKDIWICEGVPDAAIYKTACMLDYPDCPPEIVYSCGIPNWNQAHGENRMYWLPCELAGQGGCGGVCGDDYHPVPISKELLAEYENDHVSLAITAARQARFEHGQVGGPGEWR